MTAFHARHWTLTVPELVLERLEQTEEMLDAAEQIADREMEFLAHNARFHCFLELGDGPALDREIEAMVAIAELIRQPSYLWHTLCLRVVRAILDGRYADAEELAATALELGRLRQSGYPTYVFQYAQLFAIRWAQGRLASSGRRSGRTASCYPWIPRWRDALAAAELGDGARRAAEVERYARNDFADVPRDGLWLLHLCSLAEACVLIGDEQRGRLLYELLLPYGDRNAVSYTQQPFGPVALRLGMLASMAEQWEDAERHFALGARALRGCSAPAAILPRVLYEHARMLLARGAAGDEQRAAACSTRRAALSEELDLPGAARADRDAPRGGAGAGRPGAAALPPGGRHLDDRLRGRDRSGCATSRASATSRCPARLARAARPTRSSSPRRSKGSSEHAPGPTARPGRRSTHRRRSAYRRRLEELGEELEEARELGRSRAGGAHGGGDRRAHRAAGAGGRPRRARPRRRLTRGAGPRQRDEGDQVGDQDDRAPLPRSRRAPRPSRSAPASSARTHRRASCRRDWRL